MTQVHLFNVRPVGGPSIILPIPGRKNALIPAEGKPGGAKNELIDGAKGVVVKVDDTARLQKQVEMTRGLVIK